MLNLVSALVTILLWQVHHDFYEGRFLLLPGSLELSLVDLTSRDDDKECRNFGVLGKMMDMIALAFDLDYIIIGTAYPPFPLGFSVDDRRIVFTTWLTMVADLAPHNSHLNKAFCMSSDAIQPVANTDYLSASSVRYLYHDILPNVSHLWHSCVL